MQRPKELAREEVDSIPLLTYIQPNKQTQKKTRRTGGHEKLELGAKHPKCLLLLPAFRVILHSMIAYADSM